MNATIIELTKSGLSIKAIVRQTGCSRKTTRQILREERSDVFRPRTSSLEPWLAQLDHEWRAGCRTGAEFSRRLKALGFRGSLRVVSEWPSAGGGADGRHQATSARRLPPGGWRA